MNKKRYMLNILIILSMSNVNLTAMQAKVLHCIGNFFVMNTGIFYLQKLHSEYNNSMLENLPKNADTWIRNLYVKNGLKNADSIPLKIGVDTNGHCTIDTIVFNKNKMNTLDQCLTDNLKNELTFTLAEYVALHELKHYKNHDIVKTNLITTGFCATMLWPSSAPIMYLKMGMLLSTVVIFIRYSEAEAERSAYMNLSSIEGLEQVKQQIIDWANYFEHSVRNNNYTNNSNWLKKIVRSKIAAKLGELSQKKSKHDDQKMISTIDWQEKQLIKCAHFIYDWQHPSYKYHVRLAQECIDKRKAQIAA